MTEFGPYVLGEQLGRGGSARVFAAYRADDPQRTPLVIKRLHPRLAQSEDFLRRFRHEARIAALVESPHLVRVFEAGVAHGEPFIAMERVDGPSLAELFVRRRGCGWPLREAVELIAGGLSGLHVLHTAIDRRSGAPLAVVHRDVSPRNLLVDRTGRLRVIDLGLGRSNVRDWETRTGCVFGTPGYMAPELVERGRVDHRADVYSIGVVLFEMLAGEVLIARGERAAMLAAMRAPVRRPLGAYRADVPEALERTLARMLEVEVERRPESALEAAELLLAALPAVAALSPVAERSQRRVRRARVWIAAAGAVAFALIVGGAAAGVRRSAAVVGDQVAVAEEIGEPRVRQLATATPMPRSRPAEAASSLRRRPASRGRADHAADVAKVVEAHAALEPQHTIALAHQLRRTRTERAREIDVLLAEVMLWMQAADPERSQRMIESIDLRLRAIEHEP